MRKEPHPISGHIYTELGEGLVRVDDERTGKYGIFTFDGDWREGEMLSADPHMLIFIGGPDLPKGKDIFWLFTPPYVEPEQREAVDAAMAAAVDAPKPERPKTVAPYKADPGVETEAGPRSAGFMELDYFLDHDRFPDRVPEAYRLTSPMTGGPKKYYAGCYYEPEFFDLEVEHIWKKTWQMACREDEIPNIGDHYIYEVANLSFIIVRTGESEFKAHYNMCLHRGRQLKECSGKGAKLFRCPFHGWSWNLDGSLKEIPAEWDFNGVREDVGELPSAQVGCWGGNIFINPDPDCEPLEEFLGAPMLGHYEKFKLQNRYLQANVQGRIKANWKIVSEAFMESYHIVATHPQQMLHSGDNVNARYDVFGNWSRGGHVGGTYPGSPLRGIYVSQEDALAHYRAGADVQRNYLRTLIGDEVDIYSDAELNDISFNDLFPNLHPWGGFARIIFRFRPYKNNPDECLMDVMLLAPWPEGKEKPKAAPLRKLELGQSWTDAVELASLGRIIDQDVFNLEKIQRGLTAGQSPYIWLSGYQEGKIRNFHERYNEALGLAEDGRIKTQD